jgi:hypothetical protein
MKTIFTKDEIMTNKGCYGADRITELFYKYKESKKGYSIKQILKSEISIKDKRWFVYNHCKLSLDEKKKLSLKLAWIVLPVYEKKYVGDLRVRNCLQATEDFYSKKISIEVLREKRNAADYAVAAAADAAGAIVAAGAIAADYAAAGAIAAAYAVAAAAAAYADAAIAADYAVAAAAADYADAAIAYAAYAADAADAAYAPKQTYSQQIQKILIDFVK